MSEGILAEVRERLSTSAFTGETLENFIQASKIENGVVYFDKSAISPSVETSQPVSSETWLDIWSTTFPFRRAVEKAVELGHTPLVVETSLPIKDYVKHAISSGKWVKIPEGELVPAVAVWLPKDESWRGIELGAPFARTRKFLVRRNPRELLEEHKVQTDRKL